MAKHPKYNSTGGFYHPELSPCSTEPHPLTACRHSKSCHGCGNVLCGSFNSPRPIGECGAKRASISSLNSKNKRIPCIRDLAARKIQMVPWGITGRTCNVCNGGVLLNDLIKGTVVVNIIIAGVAEFKEQKDSVHSRHGGAENSEWCHGV